MSPPLSKILSVISQIRLPVIRRSLKVVVGAPKKPDSESSLQWKRFANTETLWRLWGPRPGSPWEPYHCVTLFAALDIISKRKNAEIGPLPIEDVPDWLSSSAPPPDWSNMPGTMVMLDLPGVNTITAAYYLLSKIEYQPVCTFDNWPNARGVLKPERLLGAMLFYAYALSDQRRQMSIYAPPLWICDRERIMASRPAPGRYDNRYIIEDRLLPGANILMSSGINTLVYVKDEKTRPVSTDIMPYLIDLKSKGFQILSSSVESAAEFTAAEPLELPSRPTDEVSEFILNLLHPDMMRLMRSSAGGFGGYVPHPSSGSGG